MPQQPCVPPGMLLVDSKAWLQIFTVAAVVLGGSVELAGVTARSLEVSTRTIWAVTMEKLESMT